MALQSSLLLSRNRSKTVSPGGYRRASTKFEENASEEKPTPPITAFQGIACIVAIRASLEQLCTVCAALAAPSPVEQPYTAQGHRKTAGRVRRRVDGITRYQLSKPLPTLQLPDLESSELPVIGLASAPY